MWSMGLGEFPRPQIKSGIALEIKHAIMACIHFEINKQ